MQQSEPQAAPAAAVDSNPAQAPEELHALIDRATFELVARLTAEFQLSTGSAMLLAFDSLCAHIAAGAPDRRRLLAELLRVSARRAAVSATAPPDALARLQRDHQRINADLLAAIEENLAQARAAARLAHNAGEKPCA